MKSKILCIQFYSRREYKGYWFQSCSQVSGRTDITFFSFSQKPNGSTNTSLLYGKYLASTINYYVLALYVNIMILLKYMKSQKNDAHEKQWQHNQTVLFLPFHAFGYSSHLKLDNETCGRYVDGFCITRKTRVA